MRKLRKLSTSYSAKKTGTLDQDTRYSSGTPTAVYFLELFLDTCGPAGQLAQIVKLGATYRTLAFHLDRPD